MYGWCDLHLAKLKHVDPGDRFQHRSIDAITKGNNCIMKTTRYNVWRIILVCYMTDNNNSLCMSVFVQESESHTFSYRYLCVITCDISLLDSYLGAIF